MKRFPQRLMTFLSLTFQACSTLAFVIFMYTELFVKNPKLDCKPTVDLFGTTMNKCYMRFTPNVDLTKLFHFNTKQVFLYATMTTGEQHEMCWSRIVQANDPKEFFKIVNNNYPFGIKEGMNSFDKIKFELRANLFPYVGKMKDVLLSEFYYDNVVSAKK